MGKRKRRKGEQREGTCVYCGKEGLITDDHVIPKTLFIVKDEQMVTVPACEDCQGIKELGDRDLWIFATLDMGGSQHPDMMAHLERIFDRNEQTRAWLKRSFDEAEEVPLITQAGLIVGTGLTFPYNIDRMIRTVGMMVRGLYYEETKTILPPDTPVHAQHIPWQHVPATLQQFGALRRGEPTIKGEDVVFWKSYFPEDTSPENTMWVLCFNDWVTLLGASGTLALSQQRMSAEWDARNAMREGMQSLLVLPERPWPVKVPSDADGRPIVPANTLHIPSAYGPLILPVRKSHPSFLYLPIQSSIPLSLVTLINSEVLPIVAIQAGLGGQGSGLGFRPPVHHGSFKPLQHPAVPASMRPEYRPNHGCLRPRALNQ